MQKYFLPLFISAIAAFSFVVPIQKTAIKKIQSHNSNYLYTIGNGTERTMNFYVSTDSVMWQQFTLENNFQEKLSYPQETIFFKIYSSHSNFLCYKIAGNTVYKIYFNPAIDRYDLLKY
ncbi:MAG: hypothetical protein ABI402_11085 [Ferruginibacter sp.]